jgi:hypothetical protein
MQLLDEQADDAYLNELQRAEEQLGSVNYPRVAVRRLRYTGNPPQGRPAEHLRSLPRSAVE